jgi:hypothetical protein
MIDFVTRQQNQAFEERGRQWAHYMLNRLQRSLLAVPLVWPGTREQAETIVHAFTGDAMSEADREHLVEVVQNGARSAWQDLAGDSSIEEALMQAAGARC